MEEDIPRLCRRQLSFLNQKAQVGRAVPPLGFPLRADMHTSSDFLSPGYELGSRKYPVGLRTLQGTSVYLRLNLIDSNFQLIAVF